MKVLIVDSRDYRLLYKRQLLGISDDIIIVESLEEAEKELTIHNYDLVLTSHSLKNCTGLEVSELLKDVGFTGKLVITYSGNQDQYRFLYNGNVSGMIKKITNSQDFAKYIKNVVTEEAR